MKPTEIPLNNITDIYMEIIYYSLHKTEVDMYPKTANRVHVGVDMYPKTANRVHVVGDMYPKTANRVHVINGKMEFNFGILSKK